MRVTDLLVDRPRTGKKTRITIGLFITGILSIILVFVTIYGQYTGNYLVAITKEAAKKGIAISDSLSFERQGSELLIQPINDTEDILEGFLDIEAAENTDGQYFVQSGEQHYIAYTFYLKNIGDEAVNINYRIRIIDDYKGLGDATFVKIRESTVINGVVSLIHDTNYSKALTHSTLIASEDIFDFRPGQIRKYTFFVWFDGEYSDETMRGGSIKMEWTIGITSAEEADD